MKKIILIGSLAFSALLVGCDKEETKAVVTDDKTALLTSSQWKMSSMSYSTSTNNSQSVDFPIDDCMKDDRFKFNTDGKAVRTKGTSLCTDESKEDEIVLWKFGVNQQSLDMKESTDNEYTSQRIVSLDANNLILESVNVTDSITVKINVKYIH
jgi:hypothetical protein